MVRSRLINSVITALAGFGALLYLGASNSGYFAYLMAIDSTSEFNDSLMLIFSQMSESNFIVFGSVGIIALFSYIIFAPVVGTATLSLATENESTTLMLPREHKFFDSLFLNLLSGVGILQLLIGTGIVSILSIEGSRLQGILFFLLVWFIAAIMSSLLGWARELLLNKIGFIKTLILGLTFIGSLSLLVTVLWSGPLSNAYSSVFVSVSKIDNLLIYVLLMVSTLVLAAVLIVLGSRLATKVNHNYFAKTAAGEKNKKSIIDVKNTVLYNSLLLNYLLVSRTSEVRRTIIIVGIIGVISIAFLPVDEILLPALMIGFSATFTLSWVVNYFGLLGTGSTFISGLKNYRKTLVEGVVVFSTVSIFAYNLLIIYLGYVLGKISTLDMFDMYLLSLVLSVLLPIISLFLAAAKPYRALLEGRGDTLLPPMVSLTYLASFLLISTGINLLIIEAKYNIATIALFLILAISIYYMGIRAIKYYLSLDKTQFNIIKVSNGD